MREAKSTLLDNEQRKIYDELRINYYKSIGKENHIQQPPEKEDILDKVWNRTQFRILSHCLTMPTLLFLYAVYGCAFYLYIIIDWCLEIITR